MTRFTHVHSSGRFDRALELVAKDVDHFHTIASIVSHTEMHSAARNAAFRNEGWSYAHGYGAGDGECVIEWNNEIWSLAGLPESRPLTNQTYVRSKEYGGKASAPVHALIVPLQLNLNPSQQVIVVAIHMPLDNTARRAGVWVDCTKGLRREVKRARRFHPGAKVIISADWNKNYRQADERGKIEKYVARKLHLVQAWKGHLPATGGTHGPKGLIDGTQTDLHVADCHLLPDTPSSDHRPYATVVEL